MYEIAIICVMKERQHKSHWNPLEKILHHQHVVGRSVETLQQVVGVVRQYEG